MVVTLELLPQMMLLSGSLELRFASTQHVFHSPVLSICFVCRLFFFFDNIMCIRDSYVDQKRCSLFSYSCRLKGIVLSVSVLRLQYSLKLPFSRTLACVYLQYGLLSSINQSIIIIIIIIIIINLITFIIICLLENLHLSQTVGGIRLPGEGNSTYFLRSRSVSQESAYYVTRL